MEKVCEFCTTSRPVVYCKSDAAHLCLSCDAKVHSANALSNRHLRTLLCDSCRLCPSHVYCFDHRMFLCPGCDQSVHDASPQHHQRRAVSSYLGCPSAKDFAALWGFEINELDNNPLQDWSLSNSCVSVNANVVEKGNLRQSCSRIGVSSSKSGVASLAATGRNSGSNSQQAKVMDKVQQVKNTSLVLQQILDLKKLQLTEGDGHFPYNGGLERADTSSICTSSKNVDSNLVQDISTNIHRSNHPLEELNTDLDNLLPSSTSGMPFYGESIWLSKSPIRDSQLWSQNMQDLGVCEDTFCPDDFNMPDIDLSFRNFEDLFGVDQGLTRGLLANKDVPSSSMEKEMTSNNLVNVNAISMEGISVSACTLQPFYSAMSSVSRFSNDTSAPNYLDNGVSPIIDGEASCISPDLDSFHSEARENAMMRYKEKKKARLHDRQINCASQKAKADVEKRVKGRIQKTEDYDSDRPNVEKSY
ncbi:B-box zinc finger family protein, putative isoform 3 [Hibiscus syriacus]|uniref:B-box zinc finger family protein, putative isoform 3 n=1 Tax=Hibiscus syriacus TaxID=106335 RepID=A0A6A2W813_HIBSY|nr:putative zinc finger protein At1g68190 [Hibiscus syriacus]KAE8653763.1 B-box zinc finger family protein, putative isoform 3 [Hibiscus syriacus]